MKNIKIIAHIIAINLFVIGLIGFHVLFESITTLWFYDTINFFIWKVNKAFMIDISIFFIIIAFSLEFYLSFKPIKIKE